MAEFSAYTMAKAALAAMTKSLARELAPQVRVNAVSPGAILWPEYTQESSAQDAEQARILAGIPLARLGTTADIARTVLFLARDAAYMTGQTIRVDGGRSLG
jgi:pteridine reductase